MLVKIVSLIDSSLRNVNRGFDYSFFDAIDNKKIFSNISFNSDKFVERYKRLPTNGEIGCALSHATVLREFGSDVQSGWICVLEDDAIVDSRINEFFNLIDNEEINEATVIILGYSKTKKANHFVHRLKYPFYDSHYLGEYKLGKTIGNLFGTVGYLANRSASIKFNSLDEIAWVADDWQRLSHMGINVLHLSKPLVYEDLNSESTTGNVVHCVNSILEHPYGNVVYITKVQIKTLWIKLVCILKSIF
ncbi:glycosyltransferase family 25 protein [Vibrio scophthalmi]|uniref:Glycosyl transferase family 25 domain-containing protein n=1 Tax=Vibrio scophthalmi TaxID=45658 RepID=A0A1C7FE78_9VIBR|nr:glycosyltransferase family 25 protein [Vibrio scophthalmi]ANU37674.1 hypothetical protein VSVS05_02596 [Vibrio scophthalmi]